jgi:hypothetical protein
MGKLPKQLDLVEIERRTLQSATGDATNFVKDCGFSSRNSHVLLSC